MSGTISNRDGKRYGQLTVIQFSRTEKGDAFWRCRCDCGGLKEVRGKFLQSGATKSCGCANLKPPKNKSHGMSKTPEYRAWISIKQRVRLPGYIARGITLDPALDASFEAFLAAIGPMPRPGLTVDRIDNDGPYALWNIRWATQAEQARNKSTNVLLSHNGETLVMTDAALASGINRRCLRGRIERGWSPETALNTPVRAWVRRP